MKPLVISLAVLGAILAFSLWAGRYVEGRTEDWSDQLSLADASARQERWADAQAQLRKAYADWGRSQAFFHTILEHEEQDEVRRRAAPRGGAERSAESGAERSGRRCAKGRRR